MKAIKVKGLKKYLGLMFTFKKTPLLFEFENDVHISIHSWFCPRSFVVVWMDEKNNILEQRKVKPFTSRVLPKKKYRKFLEIPL